MRRTAAAGVATGPAGRPGSAPDDGMRRGRQPDVRPRHGPRRGVTRHRDRGDSVPAWAIRLRKVDLAPPRRGRRAADPWMRRTDVAVLAGLFVEPEVRRVGMVFQDYALFPHLTIAPTSPSALKGRDRRGRARGRSHTARAPRPPRYADSYPHMLSGGERQRVALARALAPIAARAADGRAVLGPR